MEQKRKGTKRLVLALIAFAAITAMMQAPRGELLASGIGTILTYLFNIALLYCLFWLGKKIFIKFFVGVKQGLKGEAADAEPPHNAVAASASLCQHCGKYYAGQANFCPICGKTQEVGVMQSSS